MDNSVGCLCLINNMRGLICMGYTKNMVKELQIRGAMMAQKFVERVEKEGYRGGMIPVHDDVVLSSEELGMYLKNLYRLEFSEELKCLPRRPCGCQIGEKK